jgi:hypothetical protein
MDETREFYRVSYGLKKAENRLFSYKYVSTLKPRKKYSYSHPYPFLRILSTPHSLAIRSKGALASPPLPSLAYARLGRERERAGRTYKIIIYNEWK